MLNMYCKNSALNIIIVQISWAQFRNHLAASCCYKLALILS